MPLYEYYCKPCHTIFSFLSRTAHVARQPACPRCGGALRKQVSSFAFSQKMRGTESLPFATQRAAEGVKKVKGEIDRLKSEESPQRAEQFKKNFERWSGVKLDHSVSTLKGVELAPEKGEPFDEDGPPPFRDEMIYDL
jgi:putative FmdB family regulatory protein